MKSKWAGDRKMELRCPTGAQLEDDREEITPNVDEGLSPSVGVCSDRMSINKTEFQKNQGRPK